MLRMLFAVLLVICGSNLFTRSAAADLVSLEWNGLLREVFADETTGVFSGATPDVSHFRGYFAYPDECVPATGCAVFLVDGETEHVFAAASAITGLGESVAGTDVRVVVADEVVADQDAVDFAALFGASLTIGQTIDTWLVSGVNAGDGTLANPMEWGVEYIYLTSDPFSSTGFVATPPPNPDLIIFEIGEDDFTVYEAVGQVTDATFIPEPSTGAMLSGGILWLLAIGGKSLRGRCGRTA